jgi:L-alanine-DL-glutamate epimerase-like enolase superfamily enzyme
LSRALRTPIAAGDEVTQETTITRLVESRAVDVLRLDATTVGGVSEFAALRARASRAGYTVSPHAYPEIHRHLVFAWQGVEPIEVFEARSPTWGVHHFLGPSIDLKAGKTMVEAPTDPGLGIEVDWAALKSLAVRSTATSEKR